MSRVTVRVPGKLMLMGEYAVTQPGHPGIAAAIDRFLTCTVEPAAGFRLEFPTMGIAPVTAKDWNSLGERLKEVSRLELVSHTLALIGRYLDEAGCTPAPFRLVVSSELQTATGVKYGFGSSAAISVALVAAVLRYAMDDPGPDATFKLAAAAHVSAQGNGSCADIAAVTYGGVVHYQRFDADWLRLRLVRASLHDLVTDRWPGLNIQRLPNGPSVSWRVGWTGHPVSTAEFLKRMVAFKEQSPGSFNRFLAESDRAVEAFVEAMRGRNRAALLASVRQNRSALLMLARDAGLPIETDAMRAALESVERMGGAGKSSGSGGGDTLVAWVSSDQTPMLRSEWGRHGIELVPAAVSYEGMVYAE